MIEKIKMALNNIKALILANKKVSIFVGLITLVIVILIVGLLLKTSGGLKPEDKDNQNTNQSTNINSKYSGALSLASTIGNNISLNGNIGLEVIANSDNQDVSAGDYLIRFDPNLVTLNSDKNLIDEFAYIRRVKKDLISVSVVKKAENNSVAIFKDTAVFELQFKELKTGTANFELIYSPNLTSTSGLWNLESKNLVSLVSPKISISIK